MDDPLKPSIKLTTARKEELLLVHPRGRLLVQAMESGLALVETFVNQDERTYVRVPWWWPALAPLTKRERGTVREEVQHLALKGGAP